LIPIKSAGPRRQETSATGARGAGIRPRPVDTGDPVDIALKTPRDSEARDTAAGRIAATQRASLQLAGLQCGACAGLIEQAVRAIDGAGLCCVNAATHAASISWDPARTTLDALIGAIRRAGYDAALDTPAPARALRRRESRAALWRLFVAGFCMMQTMMLATPHYVARPGELAPDMKQLLDWGAWVLTLPVLWWSAAPFFLGAWRSLRSGGRIGADIPVALGIAVTFVASTGAAFEPGGPFGHEVYFDSLTMFVSFLLGGRWLQMKARHRAAEALDGALSALPDTALRLAADGSTERVAREALQPGDRVQIALGEAFAADGELLQGRTQADESLLTGESRPVDKRAGATLVAGSLNIGAPVVMRVDRVGADTRHERIVAQMHAALASRPSAADAAQRWAAPFLWCVLLLAAGAGAVWSVIDPSRALWVAVSVLIVTCPCALSLAAPAAFVAATRGLARRGVLLQRMEALQVLARVDTVFLDKTGTLTQEHPRCTAVRMLGSPWECEAALLHRAASLARWSRHPLSQAVAALAPQDGIAWSEVREHAGHGLSARDSDGIEWRLGAANWVGATAPNDDALRLWFGCAGSPLLCLEFDEQLRDDAISALQGLGAAGWRRVLLSGDTPRRVESIARRAGADAAIGAADPAAKQAAVRREQAAGHRVAMVGDGINDSPVLAQADVSFAMGHGALVARSNADLVIVSNRLDGVEAARRMARRTVRVVHQNLAWAALYNAACIPLALSGRLPPWAAGLGMALSSLLVIANSLRLSR
jgi:Cu2+-exporting ATPase